MAVRAAMPSWSQTAAQLTPEERQKLMQEARQIKADDDEQTNKGMQAVQAALRILRMRENLNTHDGQNGVPNLVSSCQQTSEQMARFNSIWDSWKNKGSYDELVKMFPDPPTLLPPKLKQVMEPLAESFKNQGC